MAPLGKWLLHPHHPRLGAAIMGRSSNRAEAEGGAEKAEPEMEKRRCLVLNLTVVFG